MTGDLVMKRVCKRNFVIDNRIIGRKGDLLTITDAIPVDNETYNDVEGYVDVKNENTGEIFNMTWLDLFYVEDFTERYEG